MGFHEGEREMQRRARSEAQALDNSGMVGASVHAPQAGFVSQREMVVVASVDADGGGLAASVLFGRPGFVRVASNLRSVDVTAAVRPGDPLLRNAFSFFASASSAPPGASSAAAPAAALLCIDLTSRKRYRINGVIRRFERVGSQHTYSFTLDVREAFFNCPKYIQRRAVAVPSAWDRTDAAEEAPGSDAQPALPEAASDQLSSAQTAWIEGADTFFLATFLPSKRLADVSHRGGLPGFIRVNSPTEIEFPDYFGNGLFNSLGNMLVSPTSAIAIVDFEHARILHVRGLGSVIETPPGSPECLDGADRKVRLAITHVEQVDRAVPFTYRLTEHSPYNYPVLRGVANTADAAPVSIFPIPLTVRAVIVEAKSARTFVLEGQGEPPAYRPGQYGTFGLLMRGASAPIIRTWTLSSAPDMTAGRARTSDHGANWTIGISVKHKPGGLVSTAAISSWRPGFDGIVLLGVGGDFSLFPRRLPHLHHIDFGAMDSGCLRHKKALFLSAGAGITPFMSMLRALADTRPDALAGLDITFIAAFSTPEDVMFARELASLSDRLRDNGALLALSLVVSTGTKPAGSPSTWRVGARVSAADLPEDVCERDVFLCGPPAFMHAMERHLGGAGVQPGRVFTEDYDF